MNLFADLLFLASAVALGYTVVLAVARLPFFPLREVVVAGPLREVTATQIEYAARNAATGNFFTVNLEAVRAAFEKLPWVRKASVRRRWPDGLELSVEEHAAVARWKHADGAEARLVNRQGEVFAASSNARLPLFVGPEGTAAQMLDRHRDLSELLVPLQRTPQVVALSARQAWQMRLDDGVLLDLGRDQAKSGIRERLARFVAVYGQAQERLQARADVIDLRYPNGFAARLARPAKN
ncbi:MAG: cell division protein FtsQ/DivIB [Rhodocyclales bacterium]|nr:cell division protein FtsQ/DivIB [Rhodocyclales bacterium]